MKQSTYIVSSWSQQVKKVQEVQQATKQQRYEKLKEFKESVCDLFTAQDFYYYAGEIGCTVSYLRNIAIYSHHERYIKYMRPQRNLYLRRMYYREHGYSITKAPEFV